MNRISSISALTAALLLLYSGACEKPQQGEGDGGGTPETQELVVVDGMVRFYLDYKENSTRAALSQAVFTSCKIQVNNKSYIPARDEKGAWFIDVEAVPGHSYTAVRLGTNSARWYRNNPFTGVVVPEGQFYGSTADFADYPCYAQYTPEDGNVLKFNDGFALLDLRVTGSATLTSIEAAAPGGEALSGRGVFMPSKNAFTVSAPAARAVLNCAPMGQGVALSDTETRCLLAVEAGTFRQGIVLTLCDSDHRMYRQTIPACTLAGGEVKRVDIRYAPDSDLIWFDGFDRFVWGGDLMGATAGFAPDGEPMGTTGSATRTGREYALTDIAFDQPGSGFIQSNTWDEVNGKKVATSHITSEDYLLSRGLDAYTYLFRCQEYPGMVVIGAGNTARGILQTPCFSNMEGFNTVKLTLRLCLHSGFNDTLLLELFNGGSISEVRLDGNVIENDPAKFPYVGAMSSYTVPSARIPVPASLSDKKEWHTIEVTVKEATSGLYLYLTSSTSTTGNHGIYLDEISVTRVGEPDLSRGTLRLLYWNIQNGMWADQPNNYDNFVAWVRKYDPDICVWCEASSIYYDYTGTSVPNASRYLPNNWAALAARYGHSYSALSGFRDNYPQETTSKYPVRTILPITNTDVSGKPVAHGAAIQEVDVNGRKIYFVTCHMWPQAYGYGVNGDAAREASKAKNEGDYYREFEMNYIVSNTINNSKYAAQQDWILLGDLNSRSRVDNFYYKYPENDTRLLTQDVIRNKTNLHDVIAESHPGIFLTSTHGNARIDYVYASDALFGSIKRAVILMDDWTAASQSRYYPSFYDPSDHRPILVDFNL